MSCVCICGYIFIYREIDTHMQIKYCLFLPLHTDREQDASASTAEFQGRGCALEIKT